VSQTANTQSPVTLAALTGGVLSALFALWAMRGLPFGGLLLWLTPLPLFAAGFAFGAKAGLVAAAIGAACVVLLSSAFGLAIYAVMFSLPVAFILSAMNRPQGFDLSLPLVLLGLWPVVVLLLLALSVDDIEGAMREAVATGVRRMGVAVPPGMVEQVARLKAAAAGLWMALLMIGNGVLAWKLVAKAGFAPAAAPDWTDIRLPNWYAPLVALAIVAWLLAGGAVALSVLLLLLLPVFFLGIGGVHRRLRGRPGRAAMLAGFYVLMLLFLQLMAPLLVGLGLFDQWRRRGAPPTT
jgi:hypothetical protein